MCFLCVSVPMKPDIREVMVMKTVSDRASRLTLRVMLTCYLTLPACLPFRGLHPRTATAAFAEKKPCTYMSRAALSAPQRAVSSIPPVHYFNALQVLVNLAPRCAAWSQRGASPRAESETQTGVALFLACSHTLAKRLHLFLSPLAQETIP